jgi:hypothetical protein
MAGMGAVAAQRPDLIRKMIKYDAKSNSYTVTFKERQADGKFKDVPIKVSAYLPTKSGASPVYAQDAATKSGDSAALWPAIIEKAYAVWKGDYQEIVGGFAGDAMEAVTGAASTYPDIPEVKDVVKLFKSYEKGKKAVCCGTHTNMKADAMTPFSGSGAGPYSGTPKAEVVEKSLRISDAGKKVQPVNDLGEGRLGGSDLAKGSVDYESAAVDLTFKAGKGPAKPDDLTANFRFHGLLNEGLNLYGEHAYMFVRVDGDKLVFANPWGPNASYQPKPMSAAEFVKYFGDIAVNAPRKK